MSVFKSEAIYRATTLEGFVRLHAPVAGRPREWHTDHSDGGKVVVHEQNLRVVSKEERQFALQLFQTVDRRVPRMTIGEALHKATTPSKLDQLDKLAEAQEHVYGSHVPNDRLGYLDQFAHDMGAVYLNDDATVIGFTLHDFHRLADQIEGRAYKRGGNGEAKVTGGAVDIIFQATDASARNNLGLPASTAHDKTIRDLQSSLPWTGHYHRDFRSTPMTHKDFGHGLTHVMKAVGGLATIINDAEHGGVDWADPVVRARVGKYLADFVVCGLRMANTCPDGVIDLQAATEARITNKNNQLAGEAVVLAGLEKADK